MGLLPHGLRRAAIRYLARIKDVSPSSEKAPLSIGKPVDYHARAATSVLTSCSERPAAPERRVDGERVDEAREQVAQRQIDDEHVRRRPQTLEPATVKGYRTRNVGLQYSCGSLSITRSTRHRMEM